MRQQLFEVDEIFMFRAIELARLGMGLVSPNPMVGCVIVRNGVILGEGYHSEFGGAHAEVNAINRVKDKSLLTDSTIYVTLEPCAHQGKTPPCADLILKHKIPNVVIGTIDPFLEVAGRGIERLRQGGCQVIEGVLEDKCLELNRRFFIFHQKKRPFILLKWAQTADGFIDIDRSQENFGQPTWITNDLSRIAVHKMRTDESAILVGTNTARKDNPSLTVREWSGRSPLRLVIDRLGNLERSLALFDQSVPTVVYTTLEVPSLTNLEFKRIDFDGTELQQILADLHRRGILSLIVEGGQKLINSFVKDEIWDEARVFVGKNVFLEGVRAPKFDGELIKSEELDDSWMFLFRRR
jgi:diaminohydroxyphosphoribosylaminopyrimidine deaminase / 5-amino-6-(5-phosphoribosylamino)uracil reductase